jgi:hypothetical protein
MKRQSPKTFEMRILGCLTRPVRDEIVANEKLIQMELSEQLRLRKIKFPSKEPEVIEIDAEGRGVDLSARAQNLQLMSLTKTLHMFNDNRSVGCYTQPQVAVPFIAALPDDHEPTVDDMEIADTIGIITIKFDDSDVGESGTDTDNDDEEDDAVLISNLQYMQSEYDSTATGLASPSATSSMGSLVSPAAKDFLRGNNETVEVWSPVRSRVSGPHSVARKATPVTDSVSPFAAARKPPPANDSASITKPPPKRKESVDSDDSDDDSGAKKPKALSKKQRRLTEASWPPPSRKSPARKASVARNPVEDKHE